MTGVQYAAAKRSKLRVASGSVWRGSERAATGVKASEFLACGSPLPQPGPVPSRGFAARCVQLRTKSPVCSAYVETLSRSVISPRMVLQVAMLRLRRARQAVTVERISGRLSNLR